MGNYSPLGAVHRHGANALVDKVTVIDSSVYPVKSDAVRSPQIYADHNSSFQKVVTFNKMACGTTKVYEV